MKARYFGILLLLMVHVGYSFTTSQSVALSATITGGGSVCVNAPNVQITLTGIGGTAPYTFVYKINGGPDISVPSVGTNSAVTIAVNTATATTLIYTLVSVQGNTGAAEPETGSTTVIVSLPPTVDFTFSENSACSGTSIQFNSTISGTGSTTYSWNFNDGTPLSTAANPSHVFTALGCGNQTFNVVLTVIRNGCTIIRTKPIIVKQRPNVDFSDTLAPFNQFNNCSNASSNPIYSITVGNNLTASCVSSFSINWGDGVTENNVTFPKSHTYTTLGVYNMIITTFGTNGCNTVKTYLIKNVSNPLGGLNSPGTTQNLCAPTANLQFSISNWGTNSLDTTYSVDYGDGTTLFLTQGDLNNSTFYNVTNPALSANFPIPHIYTTSNCPVPSFEVKLFVTNVCGTTPLTVGNITVLIKPIANFTLPPKACVGSPVIFTNTSNAGFGLNCNSNSIFKWNFGDGSPIVTTAPGPIQNIAHTYTVAGNYNVTLEVTGYCGSTTVTKTICIEPLLTPLFTLSTITGCAPLAVTATNTTNLASQCETPTYLWEVSYAPGFCGTSAPAIANQTTANATFNFTEAGIYTISFKTTNSCGTNSTTKTVEVRKPAVISINPIATSCTNTSIAPSAVIPTCATALGPVTYLWIFPGGNPATATTANPGNISYAAAGNYTVSLVVTNTCGASNTATQTFTVNPTPTITNTVLAQTICSGAATTSILLTASPSGATYSWMATASTGISGFTVSGTTATIPAQTITTSNASAGSVTYTITPTIGICIGTPITYVITVNPAPVISTQPIPSAICLNGVATPLNVAVNSSLGVPTYQWYSNTINANTGGMPINEATSATYIPPTNVVGDVYYYCIISLPSGGCSSLTSAVALVKVVALPIVTTQPIATQNICVGTAIASPLSIITNGGLGTVSYQWFSSSSNATTGGSSIATATGSAYTPPLFTTLGTFYYYVVVTFSGNNCGNVISQSAVINVFADPTTTQPLATQTLCSNATPANLVVVAAGGNGTFNYQWFSNTTNSNTGGIIIPAATSATYTPPTNTVGTRYYYCVVTQPTLGCGVTSTVSIVIINQSPTASILPIANTSCIGGSPSTLTVTVTNGVGTPNYQWYSNIANNNATGTAISGQTNITFSPPSTIAGTTFYYCLVTFPAITGSCATVATNTAEINIIPAANISILPISSQNVCVGATIGVPLSVSYTGGTGNPSYQWFINGTISNTGGTLIPGATSISYTPPVFNTAGTFYYYAQISLSGSGCGVLSSAFVEIIVSPDPIISAQPIATQTLCSDATPANLVVVASGGNGTFNYQWYQNTANNITFGTSIPGATNASYIPPTNAVGTLYYYCVITQSTLGCGVTSATAAVIINQSPSVSVQPISSTACLGGSLPALTLTVSNGAGTPAYQWFSNTINSNTPGTLLTGETNATFTPPASAIGTLFYYCSVTFSAISGSCSTVQTNTAEVIITAAATIDQNPLATQILCIGVTIPNPLTATFIGGTGTPTYQWFSNANNSSSGGIAIIGATGATYSPPVFSTAGIFYYYLEITLSGNGCSAIKSNAAEIVIVNDPTIATQPLVTQTLCQNATPTTLSVTASGGIGNTYSYQWYSSPTNTTIGGTLISGASSSSFVPPTDVVGTLFYYCVISQAIDSGCNVTSNTAQVIINAAPAISAQPQNGTYCVNQTATPLAASFINGTGTPTYQWFSNSINSNSGGNLIAGQTTSSFTPSTTIAGNVYYYVEITFPALTGGCEIIVSTTALITVNPFAIVASESETICSSNAFSIIPTDGNGNLIPIGTTYTWSQPAVIPAGALTGFAAQAIPQTEISQTLVNTTTNPATITYTVTPTSGICVGANFSVTITVNPAINPNVTVTNNACFGVNNASIATNITGGILPYIITWTGPNGFSSAATTISNIEPGTYTITIDDAGNCPFSNSYTITQPDDILIITNSQTNSTCFESNDGTIDLSITGGTGDYTYSWTKDNVAFALTQDLANLSPGVYAVTVTDANSCGPKTQTFTITEPPLLVVSLLNQTNIDCFGASTGAININVLGGTVATNYNFSWTGPNGFTSANQNLTAVITGTYNLIVTDDNGCQKTLAATLTQSTEIIISSTTTEITCYGANDASFSATIAGGNAPYTFTWNNLSTALNQNNLSAGDYIITVVDNLGCIKLATINIPEAPIFTINPVVQNVSCFGANNGSINLNLIGGIAPVTLNWSDGSTAGLTRNNLAPGTYTATITDGTPCVIIRTFIIVQPQPLVISANLTNPTNCTNPNSGAINLIVSGGTPPFTYSWSNSSTTEDLNDLIAGNYSVIVLDAKGCSISGQYNIVRPEPIVIAVTTQTDFDCTAREVTQNFNAQASGGVPPFTYQWSSGTISGPNNQSMTTETNGTVLLTVFDSLGCSQNYTVTVDNPVIGEVSFETISTSYTSYGFYSINDPIQFTSIITGDYESLFWDFGDGTFSGELNPTHLYTIPKDYVVTQTVTYPFGCVYRYVITLSVEKGYVLVVPTGFTPNNDNLNENFRPVTKNLKNIVMDIYDSWGSIIYSEKGDVIKGWDGKIKGFNAENGNYYSKVSAETFYGTTVYENQTFVVIK